MPEETYDRRQIALKQLETALRLFEEGQDIFSVVTLAGAAEEVLGKFLTARGQESHFEAITKGAVAIHLALFGEEADAKVFAERANRARNAFKHYDPKTSPTVRVDLREEAIDLLDRAVENYWLLEQDLTPAMKRFMAVQRGESAAREESEHLR